jgi:hypothetical protein
MKEKEIKEKIAKAIELYEQYERTQFPELKKELITLGREICTYILKKMDDEMICFSIKVMYEITKHNSQKEKYLKLVV